MSRRAAAILFAVWTVSTLLWLTPGLTRPDGAGYFVYLPSTMFDRDLLFFDEWAQVGLVRNGELVFKEVTPTQHLSNHWTAGTSLAWYPAYAIAGILGRDGFSIARVTAVAFTSAVAGLFVLCAGFLLARRFFSEGASLAAAIAIWFGSPMAWYATRHATMSHAISAAACAAVVMLAMRMRDDASKANALALGLAIGFACAVRPQNAPIVLVPFLIARMRKFEWLALGAVLGALPQLIVSQVLWGGPLVFVNIGGRAHPWQMFAKFRPFETIFAWYHGLATWTPLLVVAIIGFAFLWRIDRPLATAGIVLFASEWLVLSTLERWFWGGFSFGQRRFDSCTLLFILGLAALIDRVPRWLAAMLTIIPAAWTMMLFIAAAQLNLNRYQTPDHLLGAFAVAVREPQWHTILGFTPAHLRATALLTMLLLTILFTIAFTLRRFASPLLAAAYLILMSAFYAWCGMHPKYDALSRDLIARTERGELPRINVRDTVGLLHDEADYMMRTGRRDEARAALREAAELAK